MDITLEQSLASVVRHIADHAEEGTKLYFDKIPEDYWVPSVYFQPPRSESEKVTLSSYRTTLSFRCWFMAKDNWAAYLAAAREKELILLDDCVLPVFAKDGGETGSGIRVGEPVIEQIEDGIYELEVDVKCYFTAADDAVKASVIQFNRLLPSEAAQAAWENVVEEMKE